MNLLILLFLASLVFGQLASLFVSAPVYLHDVALVVLLTIAGLKIIFRRRFVFPALSGSILGFVLVSLVSIYINLTSVGHQELLTGFLYLVRWAVYSLVYVLVIQRLVAAKLWLKGLYAVGSALAILGIIQFIFYPSLANLFYLGWDPYYYRLVSTLFDPNFSGLLLVLTFFLGFSFARPGLAKLISQVLIFTALFLTFSRSSYLAFFSGLLVYGYFIKSWKLALGFALAVIIFIIIPKPGFEAFRLTREVSSVARLHNWQQSLTLFRERPIFGHGFNLLIKPPVGELPSRTGAGIDNSFLLILDTTGIVGFVVWGWLVRTLVKTGRKLVQKEKTRKYGVLFLTTLAAVGIHSLFNNSLFYPWVMIWMWVLIGAVEANSRSSTYSA